MTWSPRTRRADPCTSKGQTIGVRHGPEAGEPTTGVLRHGRERVGEGTSETAELDEKQASGSIRAKARMDRPHGDRFFEQQTVTRLVERHESLGHWRSSVALQMCWQSDARDV